MSTLAQPALISRFMIRGMHGYKDLGLELYDSVRIVIAENGTGKTTLLNALNDFLLGRFYRLNRLQFDRIECWLGQDTEPVILAKRDMSAFVPTSLTPQLASAAESSGIDQDDLLAFLSAEFGQRPLEELRSHPIIQRLYEETPYSFSQIERLIREMFEKPGFGSIGLLKDVTDRLKRALGEVEVVYLPTFRRIEIPLGKTGEYQRATARAYGRSRPQNLGSSVSSQMFFGLADVEERLSALTEEIGRKSNLGYRQISAAILDDLVAGNIERIASQRDRLPSVDALKLFFSRIGGGAETARRLNRIEDLYATGDINAPDNATLKYFLVRLAKIVDETKDIEQVLEAFVNIVNGYLRHSSDEKEFQYDPGATRVRVRNLITNSEIQLDDLSSGEKQVISLFALLQLTTKPKLILIDEPELSLSIDWQRKLLPDVVRAPTCRQLIAITHSPFIFDNELDPYAGPLTLRHFLGSNTARGFKSWS